MEDSDAKAKSKSDRVVVNTLISEMIKDSCHTINIQKGQKTDEDKSEKRNGMQWLSTESWALRL